MHHWEYGELLMTELEFEAELEARNRLNKLLLFPIVDYHSIKLYNQDNEILHEASRIPESDASLYA